MSIATSSNFQFNLHMLPLPYTTRLRKRNRGKAKEIRFWVEVYSVAKHESAAITEWAPVQSYSVWKTVKTRGRYLPELIIGTMMSLTPRGVDCSVEWSQYRVAADLTYIPVLLHTDTARCSRRFEQSHMVIEFITASFYSPCLPSPQRRVDE